MSMVSLETFKKDTFKVSIEELINTVVRKEDFAIIGDKIEPTRDLMLKLMTVTKINACNTELVQVVTRQSDTVYCFKATAVLGEKTATGHGACSTLEIAGKRTGTRLDHDALATAETRAMKRAIEAVIGLPFINELILRLFGSYEIQNQQEESQQKATEAQLKKIAYLFSKLGIKDREARLRKASNIIDRDIHSSKELTRQEASILIETLENELRKK